jgi:hypothetical protein
VLIVPDAGTVAVHGPDAQLPVADAVAAIGFPFVLAPR